MTNPLDAFNNFLPGNPISALVGEYGAFTNPTGAWDKFKNGDTNEVNRQIANQNLDFQRQNLEYTKQLNQQLMDREDNSYQRTVADMRAAGLSPLSMSGTDSAGSPLATEALHNDYQHQDMSNMAAISQVLNTVFGSLNAKQDYDIGKEQQRIQAAQADSAETQAQFDKLSFAHRLANLDYDTRRNFYQLADDASVYNYNNTFGFNSSMGSDEKAIYSIGKALNLFKDDSAHGGKTGTVTDSKLGFQSTNYRSFKSPDEIRTNIAEFIQSLSNKSTGHGKKDGISFNNALSNVKKGFDLFNLLPDSTQDWFKQQAKRFSNPSY